MKNAQGLGASEIMFTLGSTPQWAANASSLTAANSRLALYGPGSNSHPDEDAFLAFLTTVARDVRGITSFQMWNEANLKDFYLGTPAQMAQLTKEGEAWLFATRARAPSSWPRARRSRAAGPVGKFGKAYGAAMKKAGAWKSVDAVSAHFYPPATYGPATRAAYIKKVKTYYKKYGAGKKPLWDTEMNYGDRRAYMKTKKVYAGSTAATYVARTFLDAQRYGVKRVFWYGWDINVLGTDMTVPGSAGTVTDGGTAYKEIRNWMVGKSWYGCKTKSTITTCTLRGGGTKYTIRYASKAKTLKLPKGATGYKKLLDASPTQATAGSRISLTPQPVLIIGG